MPIDYDALGADAGEEIVALTKKAGEVLTKKNLRPGLDMAAVLAIFDHSFSTEDNYALYSSGKMQRVGDLAIAAGLLFDDDGEVPAAFFDNSVSPLGNVNARNIRGFLARASERSRFGGTNYLNALRWIVEEAGYGDVDLGSLPGHARPEPARRRHGLLSGFGRHGGGRDEERSESGLIIRRTAPYPTFAIFATDGEPQDSHQAIIEYLTLMSQLPIFVQFIGLGARRFHFLETLDTMDGRLIDNANFFNAEDVRNQNEMLDKFLGEFPDYYRKAREMGLITSKAA